MGCFNTTGFLSKTPILYGDRVVCFMAKIEHNTDYYGCTPYYPFSIISPICLPVRGIYNDYGSIECIDETAISEFIKNKGNVDSPQQVFDAISRCSNSPLEYELNHWHYSEDGAYEKDYYREACERLKPALSFYDKKDVPTLLFEHEEFYDKLTEENQFYVSWRDEADGKNNTNWDKFWRTNEQLKDLYEKYPNETGVIPTYRSLYRFNIYGSYFTTVFDLYEPHLSKCAKDNVNPNEEFIDDVKKIRIEPLIYSSQCQTAFDALDSIPFGTKLFEFYDNNKEEIRRVHNLYATLSEIPMYVGLSKTSGEQNYSFDKLKKFLTLALQQTRASLKKHGRAY